MNMIPLRYVGKKDTGDTDHLYGTNIVWAKPGDIQDVPEDKAAFLLNHPDVWEDARTKRDQKKDPIEAEQKPSKRLEEEEMTVNPAKIHLMPKDDLIRYALTQYNEVIDPKLPDEKVRDEVVRLMNTRG